MSKQPMLKRERDLVIKVTKEESIKSLKLCRELYADCTDYIKLLEEQISCPHEGGWVQVDVEGKGYYHTCPTCNCNLGSDLFG